MRALALPFLLFCVFVCSFAQTTEPGQFTLAGTVVNSKTGEPLRRARVSITGVRSNRPGVGAAAADRLSAPDPPLIKSALTDTGGAFRFTALPGGNYFIHASKPEFSNQDSEEQTGSASLLLEENKQNVTLRLSPLGVIEGKVVDQNNLPVRGANIVLLSQQVVAGFRETVVSRNVSTDDRGMFRLWNVQPGRYFLKAAGKSGGTSSLVIDRVSYLPVETFAPAYFGGGSALESARPIEIGAASDVHTDLTVTMEPGYRIRGTLTGFLRRQAVVFTLLRGDEEIPAGAAAINMENGQFEINDVAPGSYTLRASQGTEMRGETAVMVAGNDLNGARVTITPAVDVPYSVRITDMPKEVKDPETGQLFSLDRMDFESSCSVELHSGRQSRTDAPGRPRGEPNVLHSVWPGSYQALIECVAAYVTSATSGAQDLLINPNITIQAGAPPPQIDIVAHFGGGSVSGKMILKEAAKPGGGAGVLLVPEFSTSTGPRMIPANGIGKEVYFSFEPLAPGDYVAYGFSRTRDLEYGNAEFLKTLVGGKRIQIGPEGKTDLVIDTVIP